jgi:hypothetical protein
MVTRWLSALALSGCVFGCSDVSRQQEPQALVLRGFHLVDVEQHSVRDADIVIENGVVVTRATLAQERVIEGHGAYLMPALWDVKASLWGNDSAFDWKVLEQDANFTQCLGFHLYYGVAHVAPFAMDREFVQRELRRADALELAAAEPLYPDKVLCSKKTFGCDEVHDAASVRQAIDERAQHQVPFVEVAFTQPTKDDPITGVPRPILAQALTRARERHLPALVLVDDWQQAADAIELGASVIYGFPEAPMPDSLIELMRARGVLFVPALTRFLELNRLLGNEQALTDPFITPTVTRAVLDSYRNEQGLWHEWRSELALGRVRQSTVLDSVARAAKAGVHLAVATDSGWTSATFQGYTSHAAQAWLERAGLDSWQRLSAATVWPAALFGRHVGFQSGEAADFIALEADPTQSSQALRKIRWVMRKGELVDRTKLLPDLTRSMYKP